MIINDIQKNKYTYDNMRSVVDIPPGSWGKPCTNEECTLHQLSPYIGKVKSTIARDLIATYSEPGDVVADVFCGSGTIPLEAALNDRRVYAVDISTYAMTLTKGKLFAPRTLDEALNEVGRVLAHAETLPVPDLRKVPSWVRSFFHPETLKEAIRFRNSCLDIGSDFLMASFLGILHHQRPGFLSYPSSHLVPYLRDKKFPREEYPELYKYRPLKSRLMAKVERAYRRAPIHHPSELIDVCKQGLSQDIPLPPNLDCLITSPPYMNALDYGRDNRLRLWFLGESNTRQIDEETGAFDSYRKAMESLAVELENKMKIGGHAVFIVGEKSVRKAHSYPSAELADILAKNAPSLELKAIMADSIPDIRRSRRHLSGVKQEHILIYQRVRNG